MTTSTQLPADDVGATPQRHDGVRGSRYGEIFLIGTDPNTGRQVAGVYNTTGLNDPDGAGDYCPQELWDGLDADAITKEYNALGTLKNGPRLWCLDWVEGMIGAERDFAGLRAHWGMWLDITPQMLA